MLDKALGWVVVNPWRAVALVLGVSLVVVLVTAGGESGDTADGPVAAADSPTATTIDGTETSVGGTDVSEGDSTAPGAISGSSQFGRGFLAFKIDNAPGARPQVGIGSASLLVEVPVEGMTRFVAVFPQGAEGPVGPIRSLRPVDADLLPALAVHVVSTGGQPFVTQSVSATGIQRIEPRVFDQFISGGRAAPHDTFLDLDVLMPLISGDQQEAPGLPRGDLPPRTAVATGVRIPFGTLEFRYEADRYVRYEDGDPFDVLDSFQGEPFSLAHDALVVMTVAERPAGYEDSNGIPVSTFDVIGSGELLVFHGGEVFEGSWFRSSHEDRYLFVDATGRQFGIPAGSIYLALLPRGQETTFTP